MDDLGPNKQRLFAVAAQARSGDVLVDLGVRTGNSSFAMLEATKDIGGVAVIGVDPAPCPFICPDRYEYLQTDSISAVQSPAMPGELFLVFFDTLHIKEQVMAELYHYWPKIRVGGWAVFHDTAWPEWKHDEYLGITWGQAIEGVRAFFKGYVREEWGTSVQTYPESWGMTFVQKLTPDWNPTVPGMQDALHASQLLTEALCK